MLILVVDDDEPSRRLTCRLLQRAGLVAESIGSGAAALTRLAAGGVDAVVTDYMMPHMTGIELIAHVRAHDPAIRCVVLSGTLRPASCDPSTRWIGKPLDAPALVAALTGP